MLNHDERVAVFQQTTHGAHEFGNIVKVQARGGLVEQEQHAFFGERLFAGCFGFGGFGQEAGQLQALRFAAAECGHGLTELHVVQADVDDGLQCADDFAVVGENL